MKKFEDLEFKKHPAYPAFDTQAVMNFKNDYGVSVINGDGAYCGKNTFEVAILFKYQITYNTHIADDVIGYKTKEEVTKIMQQVQEL